MAPTVTIEPAGPDDPIFSGPRIAFERPSPTSTPDTSVPPAESEESDVLPSFAELANRPLRPDQE
jgi:hypothetical protein